MNDSKIIKALKYCITNGECCNCPHPCNACNDKEITEYAYGLIKRQQTEIDRLNIDLKAMRGAANSWKAEVQRICKKEFDNIEIDIEAVKSEAVREFAERLKNEIISETAYGCDTNQHSGYYDYSIKIGDIPEYIDNLVKEMGCNDG